MRKVTLPVTSIVLAAIVFGFLCYCQPWLMTAREQSQLWLCSLDYLGARLSEPGGLARYIGEFFVQFYYYILWGAIITALLVLTSIWLWWLVVSRIWNYYREARCPLWLHSVALIPLAGLWLMLQDINVQMTLPVAVCLTLLLSFAIPQEKTITFPLTIILTIADWWLAGPVCILLPLFAPWSLVHRQQPAFVKGILRMGVVIILLTGSMLLYAPYSNRPLRNLFAGIDYRIADHYIGTPEEQQYDLLVHLGLWNRIIEESQENPPRKHCSKYAVLLAQWQLWHTGEEELHQCFRDTWGSLSSCCASFLMSDIYLKLGWLNMSQRAAYEALVSNPNYNQSGRALKRLAETSLISGQYELVEKYTSILEMAPFYRKWAHQASQMARNPELIEKNVNCRLLRQAYSMTPDAMFY